MSLRRSMEVLSKPGLPSLIFLILGPNLANGKPVKTCYLIISGARKDFGPDETLAEKFLKARFLKDRWQLCSAQKPYYYFLKIQTLSAKTLRNSDLL